jgi:hypothetical protein
VTAVDDSPITQVLAAVEKLDADAVTPLLAHDARLRTADGREANGMAAVHALLSGLFGTLRSVSYQVTGQWHDGDVWIAEMDVTYVLRDWLKTAPLPRAIVMRQGSDGIAEVHVYGANEHELDDHPTGEEGMIVGGRWIPPL